MPAGGVFAAKLGLEDAQPLPTGDVQQKSPANDAKEKETVAAPLEATAEAKGPLPTGHTVDAGPEKPAGDGEGDKGKKQPVVAPHPVSADAQQLPGAELSAGPPAAVAQGPVQPQQGHPPPQAGAALDVPAGNQAPEKSHAGKCGVGPLLVASCLWEGHAAYTSGSQWLAFLATCKQ